MAVAVKEAQATVTKKFSMGNTSSKYIGTLALGTEYPTGGYTIGSAEASRYALPEKLESLLIEGGGLSGKLSEGKLLLYEKGTGAQVANNTNLSATPLTFEAIGTS